MSTLFNSVIGKIRNNKLIRDSGGYVCFPFHNMPKLSAILPGIQQGRYVIVTANSKVGKTQITDYLFVLSPLEFLQANPNSGLKLKIFYFSLEMSKEDKLKSLLSYRLFKDHNIILDPENMESQFQGYVLDDSILRTLESYDSYYDWVSQHLTIIDHIRNPYGIYKYMRNYAIANGKFYLGANEIDLTTNPNQLYDRYVPNDPDEYVIVITDHVSLLQPEQTSGNTLWNAMFDFSSNYCLKMRDNFKYTVVNVQQQAMDQEKQQFTFKGESITAKLKPSPDGLGDCKLTGRDCDLMLGLFSPAKYQIPKYPIRQEGAPTYDITKLRDNYRELSVILNRRGGSGKNLHLYFNGACNYFEELPTPENINYERYL
jgi:hypothetical protein